MAGESGPMEKKWYTVADAAKYLGISQPTIFRWMKDGLLSFYKIGGATRFSQECLDAVVEKVTGQKEAEAAAGRCAACGHGIMIDGTVQGMSQLNFRPQKTKFWVWAEALVPLKARVCAACGYVQMHADTDKLNRLRPDDENAAVQAEDDSAETPDTSEKPEQE